MAKYQVETEKGSFTLNGGSATALASALLVKLNNQRANGYKINGSYGDNMFSVVLVDKDKKPFKEYYLKKVGKTQDKSPLSFMDSVVRAFKDEKKYYRVVLKEMHRGFTDLINCVVFANDKAEAEQKALSYFKNKYKADIKKGSVDFVLLKVAEHENQKKAKANL